MTNTERNLFRASAGGIDVDGDLLGIGAGAAVAEVEDNFRADGGSRGRSSGEDGIYDGSGLTPVRFFKGGLQTAERLLCAGQIAGLQGRADGGEILFALGVGKRISAGKGPALAEVRNCLEGGLSGRQITRPMAFPSSCRSVLRVEKYC